MSWRLKERKSKGKRRKDTVVKLLEVNVCWYVHVDVELILQLELAEQVDEPYVNDEELKVKIKKEKYGPTLKLEHGLVGFIGDVLAPERARYEYWPLVVLDDIK